MRVCMSGGDRRVLSYLCVDNLSCLRTPHIRTGGDDSIRHPALRKPARFQPRTTPTSTADAEQGQQQQQVEESKDRGGMIVMELKDPNLAAEVALSVLAPLAEIVLEQREALVADKIGQGRRKGPAGAGE